MEGIPQPDHVAVAKAGQLLVVEHQTVRQDKVSTVEARLQETLLLQTPLAASCCHAANTI